MDIQSNTSVVLQDFKIGMQVYHLSNHKWLYHPVRFILPEGFKFDAPAPAEVDVVDEEETESTIVLELGEETVEEEFEDSKEQL